MSARPNLLLVDDSEDIRHLFQIRLRELGTAYHAVETAAEAWTLAHRLLPDLLLLDVNLGEESGLTLCRRLREHPATARLAIAMFSAAEDTDSQIASLAAGADDHLAKNLPGPLLIARCRACMRRGRIPVALAELAGIDLLTGLPLVHRLPPLPAGLTAHTLSVPAGDPAERSAALAALAARWRDRAGWVAARGEGDTLVLYGPAGAPVR